MIPSNVIYGADARKAVEEGMSLVGNAVKTTLGPKGRNVLIQPQNAIPILTKDGVTVARSVNVMGSRAAGANFLKDAAQKTNQEAGDATTTTTVLAMAMFSAGRKIVDESNDVNSVELKAGIEYAAQEMVEILKSHAIPVGMENGLDAVATVSANGDAQLGSKIAEALRRVGKDGSIMVESVSTMGVAVEISDGVTIDRGMVLPHFATSAYTMKAVHANPLVLLYDGKIRSPQDIMPCLQYSSPNPKATPPRPLIIVCNGAAPDINETLANNHMQHAITVAVVDAPGDELTRHDFMDDLAVVLGGQLVSTKKAMVLEKMSPASILGTCALVEVSQRSCTFTGWAGREDKVEERKAQLQARIEALPDGSEKTFLTERLARLAGAIATLKVGHGSGLDRSEKLYRVEDAINATRAAMQEGIVPGGGVALVNAARELNSRSREGFRHDFVSGMDLVIRCSKVPFEAIMHNAGLDPNVGLCPMDNWNSGVNAMTGEVVDMVEAGIIDPVKATRVALLNAASTAASALTIEVLIDNQP
jgi:chaperonin GroEL